MATLSLCMIVRNEKSNIIRCLSSVQKLADELIVVDTGSVDQTPWLARQAGAKVFFHPWQDDFSAARNFSLEQATSDWILFLDADEELAPCSKQHLDELLATGNVDGYFLKITNYIGKDGWVESCPDLVFRLFRNSKDYRFYGAIHEQIADVILAKNPPAAFQIAPGLEIIHYGYLDEQINSKNKKSRNLQLLHKELEAQPHNQLLRYHYGVELFRAEKYHEAVPELITAANNLDPSIIYYPKLLRYIVMSRQSAGLFTQALTTINTALGVFPDYADLYYYAGLIYLQLKQYANARDSFRQAVSLPEQPLQYASFAGVRGFRSLYHLGQIAETFLDYEEAIKYYLAGLRDNSGFVPALEGLARLLKPREDPDYALFCLEKALDLSDPRASRSIGGILFKLEAYGLALRYLQYSQQALPFSAQTDLWLAICLIQERRYDEAFSLLEDYQPDNSLYHLALINKLFAFGIQGNIVQMHNVSENLFSLTLAEGTQWALSLLVSLFEEAPYALPDVRNDPDPDGLLLLLEITRRLLYLKETNLASKLWEQVNMFALQENSGFILNLAEAFYDFGQFTQAEKFLQLTLNAENNARAHSLLAEILAAQENFSEAVSHCQLALALDPDEPGIYIRQIELYEAWRQKTLQEALAKYPDLAAFRQFSACQI